VSPFSDCASSGFRFFRERVGALCCFFASWFHVAIFPALLVEPVHHQREGAKVFRTANMLARFHEGSEPFECPENLRWRQIALDTPTATEIESQRFCVCCFHKVISVLFPAELKQPSPHRADTAESGVRLPNRELHLDIANA
jgi:hypothetical protein